MSDDGERKVVNITGRAVGFAHGIQDRLFTPEEVLGDMPLAEIDELVVIGRTHKGELYLAGTHSTSIASLLLGQASDFVHRVYKPYGSVGGE